MPDNTKQKILRLFIMTLACAASLATVSWRTITTRPSARPQQQLNGIADQVVLPQAYNLIHRLVGPSVVAIHLREQINRLYLERRCADPRSCGR